MKLRVRVDRATYSALEEVEGSTEGFGSMSNSNSN